MGFIIECRLWWTSIDYRHYLEWSLSSCQRFIVRTWLSPFYNLIMLLCNYISGRVANLPLNSVNCNQQWRSIDDSDRSQRIYGTCRCVLNTWTMTYWWCDFHKYNSIDYITDDPHWLENDQERIDREWMNKSDCFLFCFDGQWSLSNEPSHLHCCRCSPIWPCRYFKIVSYG